ncbi:hypothetical protein IV102_26425 [bacterium]|nr:hypothetical protein [bacterium]
MSAYLHEGKNTEVCAQRIRRTYEGALEGGEKNRDLGGEPTYLPRPSSKDFSQ